MCLKQFAGTALSRPVGGISRVLVDYLLLRTQDPQPEGSKLVSIFVLMIQCDHQGKMQYPPSVYFDYIPHKYRHSWANTPVILTDNTSKKAICILIDK